MIWMLAFALWASTAAGLYLALSRDVLRCVMGLALLGSAVNILLLMAGRIQSPLPAVIPEGAQQLAETANARFDRTAARRRLAEIGVQP